MISPCVSCTILLKDQLKDQLDQFWGTARILGPGRTSYPLTILQEDDIKSRISGYSVMSKMITFSEPACDHRSSWVYITNPEDTEKVVMTMEDRVVEGDNCSAFHKKPHGTRIVHERLQQYDSAGGGGGRGGRGGRGGCRDICSTPYMKNSGNRRKGGRWRGNRTQDFTTFKNHVI